MLGGAGLFLRLRRAISTPKLSFYDQTIEKYAQKELVRHSLADLVTFARGSARLPDHKLVSAAKYIHEEMPKRLARRLIGLQSLPYVMVHNPHIARVYEIYQEGFHSLVKLPVPRTIEDDERMTDFLKRLVFSTVNVVELLSAGVGECMKKSSVRDHVRLDEFVDEMMSSRLHRRVLAEQHIMLHEANPQGFCGIVNTRLCPADAVREVADVAGAICHRRYGIHPHVIVSGDLQATVVNIPAHLNFVLLEVLKNSMRATVEAHKRALKAGATKSATPPPIQILIVKGKEEITMRISDQGGGIPKQHMEKIFRYGFTTVDSSQPSTELTAAQGVADFSFDQAGAGQLAGYGFGLGLCKVYLETFAGTLTHHAMEGYGTDTYITLATSEKALHQIYF